MLSKRHKYVNMAIEDHYAGKFKKEKVNLSNEKLMNNYLRFLPLEAL